MLEMAIDVGEVAIKVFYFRTESIATLPDGDVLDAVSVDLNHTGDKSSYGSP